MMSFSFLMCCSFFLVFCGVWGFVSSYKHLLNTLLSLEFLMLGIFWNLSFQIMNVGNEVYFCLFFLTLAACEGALGLSLLILIVRSHGNDQFMKINLLEC